MRTPMIVLLPPLSSHGLRLVTIGEKPAVEMVSPKRTIETLNRRILPRTTGYKAQPSCTPGPAATVEGHKRQIREHWHCAVSPARPGQKQLLQLLNNLTRENGVSNCEVTCQSRQLDQTKPHQPHIFRG